MKKTLKYLGIFLPVILMGALTGCLRVEEDLSADIGLGIKVFAPTKVVAGQPMTINGSGFSDVREIVFPDGVTVTDFEIVSKDMIRVKAPAGISASGGNLIVRTADEQAESRVALTLGNTVVSGFSKNAGEEIEGGEQLTVYGTDLEFICRAELLDPDGQPLILSDADFYRKGTSSVVITIPNKIFEGTYVGKLYTFDGKEIPLPELSYKPGSGGGHWETVKSIIWENDDPAGHGAVSWNGTYRFALEGHDGNNEAIAELPQDLWDLIKTETFYVTIQGENPQIRVVTGWWNNQWPDANDIQPGNDLLTDNGDGTWTLTVNLKGSALADAIDVEHLLFTGDRYTVLDLYVNEDIWVDGGGHSEIVDVPIWENDDPAGHGAVSWNGTYRFALEGHDGNNEAIAELPQDVWDKIKTETFYVKVSGENPQIRVVTGWWNNQWPDANDIQPGNDLLTDNGDGTWTLTVNLKDSALADAIDVEHLLFTGDRYTVLGLYFQEEIWVDGGGDSPKETVIWEGDGSAGAVSWNGIYRFALEGHDGNNEAIAELPQDVWDMIKTKTFYVTLQGENPQIRVVTGWWNNQWPDANDIQPGNDLLTDNGDGTWTLEVNLNGSALADAIDVEHLLFTGDRYTPLKLYFRE